MKMSPSARSLQHARGLGWLIDGCERRLPRCNITRDLFNAFDLLAVEPGVNGAVGIQVTSASNGSARWKKLIANPALAMWLAAGNRVELWLWSKKGPRGQVKQWTLDRRVIELKDLQAKECERCNNPAS